jgi:hypothetical protein
VNHSNWIRQSRMRARRYDVPFVLSTADVVAALAEPCAACGGSAVRPDLAVPISSGGPGVVANLLGLCGECHRSKALRSLPRWFESGGLSRGSYSALVLALSSRPGWELVKPVLRKEAGL